MLSCAVGKIGEAFDIHPYIQDFVILAAAVGAGAANAAAGGGTNISFPTLLWAGLPAIQANATNAVGLLPGSMGAAWSYRGRIRKLDRRHFWLLLPSLTGGGLGAWMLIYMPPGWFRSLAPYFVFASAGLMAAEPYLKRCAGNDQGDPSRRDIAIAFIVQFVVSVYGGYFGAGIGLLMLAALGAAGVEKLQNANALKNLLTIAIKGVAVIYFVTLRLFEWHAAVIMVAGSVTGGYLGGLLVKKVGSRTLRYLAVAIGVCMAVLLLVLET